MVVEANKATLKIDNEVVRNISHDILKAQQQAKYIQLNWVISSLRFSGKLNGD